MTKKILAALAILLTVAVGGHAQEQDFTDLVKQLAEKLGGQDLYARGEAARMLETMCNHASRPGADAERAAVCKAMVKALGPDTPKMGRVWLLRQLEKNGRAEVVDTLAGLFLDPDELIRQQALLALANNPSEEAAAKLREALKASDDSYARIAIINSIGYRRDPQAVEALAKWMDDNDERVADAAVAALGAIGNADALAVLDKKAVPTATGVDAYLRCLQAVSREKHAESAESYLNLYQNATARQQKLAGLRGVAVSGDSEKAVAALVDALSSKDVQIQLAAAQLSVQAGPQVAGKVLESFDRIPASAQAALLSALGDRAVNGAKEKALEAINSRQAAVRVAAIGALGSLGDQTTALMLAKLASQKSGAEQAAARESVSRIRGTDVDAALLAALNNSDAKVQAELIRALAARRAVVAIATLENLAKTAPDASVRVEAINALGAMARPNSLPTLLEILLSSRDQKQSQAAEAAIAAVLARIENSDERAVPLLEAISKTTGTQRMALLRLLGRTGSSRALEALRRELKEGDPQMHDATVRALSEWPDAAVIADLLAIAKEDPSQTNKVLALRGYVRVVALPSDRRPAETARMLGDALTIATTSEKKAILGALGAVGAVEALHLAAPLMDNEEVRNESITATLRIARTVAGTVPDEATTAANHALELSQDEAVKRNVAAIIQAAERSRDFVTDWFVAGPYMQEGKEKDALFDMEFAPEKGEDAKWTKMPANPDRSRFWEMNLDSVSDLRGDHRAAYLRTKIYVPKAQELQLEVGSDDAIKVWVNGKLVHANNASRGDDPGQDRVKITLDEGWNTMMMKVINGGGGWGANARLRTLDDKKVAGMKVKAE
ncbi:MAG TPA: HEAT repeat domain-containing protein [Tepidisphaeraceae bacterium]|jgi:HEAT repeat protein|nr:HEAT repeat domain-containing protein [Tepidisphaeraceae bacterium]